MDNKVIYVGKEENTSSSNKPKINLFKIFTMKNIKILVLVFIAIIASLIIFNLNDDEVVESTSVNTYGYISTMEYCAELESKLENLLSNVKGAGQVKCMVTVNGSPELVYAKDEDEKITNNSGGTTSSNSSSPIIVTVNGDSNALILTEKLPEVKGVIVVSSGANDVSIKLNILNAVSTLLNISIDKVSVLNGI